MVVFRFHFCVCGAFTNRSIVPFQLESVETEELALHVKVDAICDNPPCDIVRDINNYYLHVHRSM